jgi:hypothetical protein
MYPPPMRTHFSQRSSHFWKAPAKSSLLSVLMTPSHFVLNSQHLAHQLPLQRGELKIVYWGLVRRVRGVGDHLDLLLARN